MIPFFFDSRSSSYLNTLDLEIEAGPSHMRSHLSSDFAFLWLIQSAILSFSRETQLPIRHFVVDLIPELWMRLATQANH